MKQMMSSQVGAHTAWLSTAHCMPPSTAICTSKHFAARIVVTMTFQAGGAHTRRLRAMRQVVSAVGAAR
jgi:hypothetical protein